MIMTKKDIDLQAYTEMTNLKMQKQNELDAYFKGFEEGLKRTIKILENHIKNKEEGEQK